MLKIDQSLVAGLDQPDEHRAHQPRVPGDDALSLVAAVVGLGRALGLELVGKGVETPDAARALQGSGCVLAQGYLFARPMPIDALRGWLRGAVTVGRIPAQRLKWPAAGYGPAGTGSRSWETGGGRPARKG